MNVACPACGWPMQTDDRPGLMQCRGCDREIKIVAVPFGVPVVELNDHDVTGVRANGNVACRCGLEFLSLSHWQVHAGSAK